MMHSEGPNSAEDRRLWQRCRTIDAEDDEAARFLDLAAYADGLLDIEERERIAALLAADPQATAEAVTTKTAIANARVRKAFVVTTAISMNRPPEPENQVFVAQKRQFDDGV